VRRRFPSSATSRAGPCSLGNSTPSLTMKTLLISIAALPVAIAALFFLPASSAPLAFTVAGLLPIFVADYGRAMKPLRLPARIIPFTPAGCSAAGMSKAA
jgi:hypothetical protein